MSAFKSRRNHRDFHVYSSESRRWSIEKSYASNHEDWLTSSDPDVVADVSAIVEGFGLQQVRRYFRQRSWESESSEAEFSDRVEPGLKLENVAAHSWHVADIALLLGDRFPELDLGRCLALAILHDKLEMFTGDFDPIGKDGLGTKTHAFDATAARRKDAIERQAAAKYLSRLRVSVRKTQEKLLNEIIEARTLEARFVKAIDKMQAMAFVIVKKNGKMTDQNLHFVLRYTKKIPQYFPLLSQHHQLLRHMLLDAVALARGWSRLRLETELFGQLELEL